MGYLRRIWLHGHTRGLFEFLGVLVAISGTIAILAVCTQISSFYAKKNMRLPRVHLSSREPGHN